MSMVDWSLAPSWCNGYGLIGYHGYPVWFDDDQYQYLASGDVHKFANGCTYTRSELQVIERRKKPWSGPEDGLPPVNAIVHCGTHNRDVEVLTKPELISHASGEYVTAACRAIDNQELFWGGRFNQIRTPSEIAAEKRETAIREFMDVVGIDCRVTASKAVDAGFKREVV